MRLKKKELHELPSIAKSGSNRFAPDVFLVQP